MPSPAHDSVASRLLTAWPPRRQRPSWRESRRPASPRRPASHHPPSGTAPPGLNTQLATSIHTQGVTLAFLLSYLRQRHLDDAKQHGHLVLLVEAAAQLYRYVVH